MRDIDEMLEEFEEIIEELRELARQSVILVEGRKDRHALDVLGVHGDIVQVQDARAYSESRRSSPPRGGAPSYSPIGTARVVSWPNFCGTLYDHAASPTTTASG